MSPAGVAPIFPPPLSSYATPADGGLLTVLGSRIAAEPFNLFVTAIFALAIIHTMLAAVFVDVAHRVQHRSDERARAEGRTPQPNIAAELLHFLGEVEVVFGLWVVPLLIATAWRYGWETATHYVNDTVVYTEALFVIVIMALASTRPIVAFAESALRRVARVGGCTPAAWWVTIVTVGPLLGSFITEPAAMTICALLLARQFFDLGPSRGLKYATLGLLFVNVSIGGTLTHFAAPPVLMVSRPWGWDTPFMLTQFGWRAVLACALSTLAYFMLHRRELRSLASLPPSPDVEVADEEARVTMPAPLPAWVTAVHLAFMAWTVINAHYPALFLGGFLFFLGFARATAVYQTRMDFKGPLLVGFFLGGLVIHGGLQGWWIAPVLSSLPETPLFVGAAILTAFNDNALITYLATLAPDITAGLRTAVVAGAVTGGGLTVIANAPNPAGQALLSRFFDGAIHPLSLLRGAILPTLIAAVCLHFL
jgi:hypothetical protein